MKKVNFTKTSSFSNSNLFPYQLLISGIILIIACIIGVVLVIPYIGEKLIFSCDYITHYGIAKIAVENIKAGKGIFTVFPQMGGIPFHSVYQPLFHLIVAGLHFLSFTKISVAFFHNLLVALSLALFPLSIYYCLRKFEFTPLISGLGALFSLAPISGWGHTINAYLDTGVVTQSLGAFIFPITLGYLYQYLKKRKGNIVICILLITSISLIHPIFLIFFSLSLAIFCIIFIGNSKFGFRKIFKIISIFIISLLIISFWLIPFYLYRESHGNLSDWYHLPTSHEVSFTSSSFIKVFLGGEILDKVNKNSLLTQGGYYRQKFRWPHNADSSRIPFFTIFTIIGFLISSFKIKRINYSFFSLGWITTIFLLLGRDDVKLLSHFPWYTTIRVIILFEFFSVCLAAIGLFYVIKGFFIILNPDFSGKKIVKITLIFFIIVGIFSTIYRERYITSRNMIEFLSIKKVSEITSLFSKVKDKELKPRIWFKPDKWQFVRALFPFNQFPIIYTDFFIGYLLSQKLIRMNYKDISDSKRLVNLYNISYIISKRGNISSSKYQHFTELNYSLVNWNQDFALFRTPGKHNYFQFLKYKPILVFSSVRNWARLCRIWLRKYSKGEINEVFFIHSNTEYICENKDINVNKHPVIFLFDYKIKDKGKAKRILNNYINSGGVIVSFKPIFDLPIKIITKDNNNFSRILKYLFNLKKEKFNNKDIGKVKTIKNESDKYMVDTINASSGFILFKMNYWPNWKITVDGRKVDTYRTTPSFTAIYIPQGKHLIKAEWVKTRLQHISTLISIYALIGLVIFGFYFKRRKVNNEP